jgi:exonuclease SbcD
VRWLDLPVVRPLSTVAGPLAEVLADHEDLAENYLAVRLTDPVRPLDPMRRLREVFPYAVTLSWEPVGGAPRPTEFPAVSAATPDDEVIARFVADCRGAGPTAAERELIAAVVAERRAAEVTA